jgi:hypothetical protein
MENPSQCVFARLMLNAVRRLTQILLSRLMMIFKWNTRVSYFIIKQIQMEFCSAPFGLSEV